MGHHFTLIDEPVRVPPPLDGMPIAWCVLTLAATIWHNWAIGAPVKRSLIAYDH